MKITKEQLKQIIKEELETTTETWGRPELQVDKEQAQKDLVSALQQANRHLGEEAVKMIFDELMNTEDVKGFGRPV